MKRFFRTLVPTLLVLGLALLSAPAIAQESTAPESTSDSDDKLTFVVGTLEDISSVNPFSAGTTGTDYEMLWLTYDMLQNYDPETLAAAPGAAESYEVSDDGLTYTYKIPAGRVWSDGKPVTARDVAFTYNFIMQNEGTGNFTTYLGDPADYDPKTTFTAPDDETFVWKLKKPSSHPTAVPYITILPEHVFKQLDGKDAGAVRGFSGMPQVSGGPFVVTEWKRGQYLKLDARDDYWGGTPTVDEVIFRIFDNQEAMVTALKEGEVDAVNGLTPQLFNSLKGVPGITTLEATPVLNYNLALNVTPTDPNDPGYPSFAWYEGTVSTGSPALHDTRVRQAIAYSLDKQELVDKVAGGYGEVSDSFLLPQYPYYSPPSEEYDYQHTQDMAKAKALMDEAGYVDSDGDGVREEKDGSPMEFDLLVLANNEYSNQSGKFVKEWLTELGWKVNLKPLSGGKITSLWYESDYDGYMWNWGNEPDPNFMLSIFTRAECLNWSDTCWDDDEYEELFKAQLAETDVEKRKEIVAQMQDIYYREAPEQFLFRLNDLQAYRSDKWEGFVNIPAPSGGVIYSWGPATYVNVTPIEGAAVSSGGESGGSNAFLFIGVGVVVLVGIGLALRARARKAEDDA